MKANELRVGNWVKDSREDYPCRVLAIDSEHSLTTKDGEVYVGTATCSQKRNLDGSRGRWLKFLDPIPLTEELLLKCGFKVERESGMSKHYYTNKKILLIDNQNDSYDPCLLCDYRGGSEDFPADKWFERYGVTISYLHQLQNLYFALTGEELEVKL